MIVDFHCQSTASDGTCAPAELAARGAGFAAMALTDHDNCDGVGEFLQAGKAPNGQDARSPMLVAGIELSIEPGEGFDKFHLLSLGIDPQNAELKAFLMRVLDGRNGRNERILANFRRLGIEMVHPSHPSHPSQPSQLSQHLNIFSYAHGEVLARPHFARWLMERGYVGTIAEAFQKYLLPESPRETRCYEERYHPDQEEALAVVHGAGGLAVMAHPKYWRRTWRTVGADYAAAERELAALKERGLDGVETLYQANTPEENVEFTRMALKLGYLKSAGSDFHGANKPQIPLGMEVSERFIAPLMERIGRF